MATKRARKSEPGDTELIGSDEVGVEASHILLTDVRVVKLHSERFLTPEDAARGSYTLAVNEGDLYLPDEPTVPCFGTLMYSVELIGYKRTEEKPKSKEDRIKSFSVSLDLEAKFEIISGSSAPNPQETVVLISGMMGQIHAVAIERLRVQTADLGYRAVRPDLGRKAPKPHNAKKKTAVSEK